MAKKETAYPRQMKNKKYMLVRYGRMNNLGLFEHNEGHLRREKNRVIVKTDRGLELGCLVGNLVSYKGGQLKFTDDQIKEYFDKSEIDFSTKPVGKFIRYATSEDISEKRHLEKIAEEEMDSCRRIAEELGLSMKLVAADHIFGGERIIFYFIAESRIDFRELVKRVANEYQTRIEMRQIGSRDEAKLLGDYETCGQQCCCQRFLKTLKPVNMRMAKMQKATLDPSKISGFCGRLKCCLRYEDQTYNELKKRLPKKNSRVKTSQGQGRVVDMQILTQLVMIEYDTGGIAALPVEDIEVISQPTSKNKTKENEQIEDDNDNGSENLDEDESQQ